MPSVSTPFDGPTADHSPSQWRQAISLLSAVLPLFSVTLLFVFAFCFYFFFPPFKATDNYAFEIKYERGITVYLAISISLSVLTI